MPEIPVYDHEAVLAAVTPSEAIERVRQGFVAYAHGDWAMPAKTYVTVPNGDFRAMPAQGGGLAILKWITSFPGNPDRGLPVVQGVISVSRAETGEPLALIDARAVTALRTGAVAAVAAQELAREDAASVGLIGCGVYGSWAARCLAARGVRAGRLLRPRSGRARARSPASSPAGRPGRARTRWPATSSPASLPGTSPSS